jgi:hypothetical protein
MKDEQRIVITIFWNEGADAREIADRFQAEFGEHAHQLRMIRFWIAEARPIIKTCMMKFALQDLRSMIWTRKFWRYSTNPRLNQINR